MTFALQVFMTSGAFCAFIIVLLVIQKNGYLKHKIITALILFASMLFLIAASAFLHYEFSGYDSLKKSIENYNPEIIGKKEDVKFTSSEITIFEDLQESKNKLSGYESFLINSAESYDPSDFSNYNKLKENIISQFESREYDQEYWNKVFNLIFYYNEDKDFFNWSNYTGTAIIPVKYTNKDLTDNFSSWEEFSNAEYVEYLSIWEYCERKIKTIDRDPENLKSFWADNKSFVYTFFSKSRYEQLCKHVVDDLITIYDTIILEPDYKEFYLTHKEFDTNFLDFPSKEFTDEFINEFEGGSSPSWPFGFWDRRFEESNDKVVYEILKEIQEHYKY